MTAAVACMTCGTELRPSAKFCGAPVTEQDTRAEYKQVTVLFAEVVIPLGSTFRAMLEWQTHEDRQVAYLGDREYVITEDTEDGGVGGGGQRPGRRHGVRGVRGSPAEEAKGLCERTAEELSRPQADEGWPPISG